MLRRRTPLKSSTTGLRRTPLARVSGRRVAMVGVLPQQPRPRPAVSAATRRALTARSGGWCEIQLVGCLGPATDPAHRIARAMGGRHGAARVESERLSNALHACRNCHQWSTARPAESYELGLMLRSGTDPATEPVLYRGRTVLLDDQGGVSEYAGRAA